MCRTSVTSCPIIPTIVRVDLLPGNTIKWLQVTWPVGFIYGEEKFLLKRK
jgi:hypothetical protein